MNVQFKYMRSLLKIIFLGNKYFRVTDCNKHTRTKKQFRIFALRVCSHIVIYLKPAVFIMDSLGIANRNGCPMLTFTAVPCPFCGLGRSFSCLTDFNFAGAFGYNPSGPVIYILGSFVIIYLLILSFKSKMVVLTDLTKRLWVVPIILLAGMWVLNVVFGKHF